MGLARTKSAARFFIWANCPATLEAISPGSRRLRLCRRASAWAPKKLRGVCQTGAPAYISEPPCLRVSVWLHSLGRRQNTFLPRLFARTIRTKRGSSSDGRASALHAEGRGIDALLLHFVFCLFSSDWFPFETREASDDAGLRPHSRKITRFPVFCLSFWPLVSSLRPIRNRRRPIRTSSPIVRSRIVGATRHLRVTNDRVERRRPSLAGRHSVPARHAAVSGPSETARPGTPSSTSPEATHARERHRQGPPHLNARRWEHLG